MNSRKKWLSKKYLRFINKKNEKNNNVLQKKKKKKFAFLNIYMSFVIIPILYSGVDQTQKRETQKKSHYGAGRHTRRTLHAPQMSPLLEDFN